MNLGWIKFCRVWCRYINTFIILSCHDWNSHH